MKDKIIVITAYMCFAEDSVYLEPQTAPGLFLVMLWPIPKSDSGVLK